MVMAVEDNTRHTPSMRRKRPKARVVLFALLGLLLSSSACIQTDAADTEGSAQAASPASSPVEAPDADALGLALPGPSEIGGIGGYSSCLADETLCADIAGPDPTMSWVHALTGDAGEPGARWAFVTVRSEADPQLQRRNLELARDACSAGEFITQGDPRGRYPQPPTEGSRQPHRVEEAGFEGTRCDEEIGSPNGAQHAEHSITAARDDALVTVWSSSGGLAARLFEEYVARLDS